MYKTIDSSDLSPNHPSLSLIDIHSKGVDRSYMLKTASMMTETISKIRPEPGSSFIHLVAMGASEYYGSNRNGDWFNESSKIHTAPEPKEGETADVILGPGLKHNYATFKSNANVYREHANKDVSKRRGTVLDSAYNDVMHRVELVIKVDNNICSDALNKIANNDQIMYSMACVLPHDTCSFCHNKAHNASEYCTHIKTMLNRITKTGHKVVMINDNPTFFDISFVLVPADRIAGTLRKIASNQLAAQKMSAPLPVFLNSTDPIVQRKAATLSKLAEIEKQIESNLPGVLGTECNGVPTEDLPEPFMNELCRHDPMDAIKALNGKHILLSLPDYLKLVTGGKSSEVEQDIPDALCSLPTMFNDLASGSDLDSVLGHDEFNEILSPKSFLTSGIRIPDSVTSGFSLAPESVKHRTIVITINGGPTKYSSYAKQGKITKRGSYLAKEYSKYALSYGAVGSNLDRKMIIMRNRVEFTKLK